MQAKNASSWVTLGHPDVVSLLRRPQALRVLAALATETTVQQVATRLHMQVSTVLRWVRRWAELGAVRPTRTQARAGRPITRYRMVSTALFVPYESFGDVGPEDAVMQLLSMRLPRQSRSLVDAARLTWERNGRLRFGAVVYVDRHGELVVRPDFHTGKTPRLTHEGQPAYLNFHTESMKLSAPLAKKLQRELVEIVARYKSLSTATGDRYVLSVVFAPNRDSE